VFVKEVIRRLFLGLDFVSFALLASCWRRCGFCWLLRAGGWLLLLAAGLPS